MTDQPGQAVASEHPDAATTIKPGADWVKAADYNDIEYHVAEGIAKITINRPEVRNAFRPQTLFELTDAFDRARDDDQIGVIILTGKGDKAFCSGGDQRIRGDDGYIGDDDVAHKGIGRLNVLDLQVQIRRTPKPVVAMIAGYAVGGGHVLHVVCDLSIAAENARFSRRDRRSVRSTADTARVCWPVTSGRSGRARSGSCAVSMTPQRPSTGAWSTLLCPSRTSRSRQCSGAARCSSIHLWRFGC